jgi:hypothetical protein
MTGDYHTWPEQWAIDSVQQTQKAYQNIEFADAAIDGQRLRITIQLPSGYIDKNQAIAAQQLAKAAFVEPSSSMPFAGPETSEPAYLSSGLVFTVRHPFQLHLRLTPTLESSALPF